MKYNALLSQYICTKVYVRSFVLGSMYCFDYLVFFYKSKQFKILYLISYDKHTIINKEKVKPAKKVVYLYIITE